MKLLTILFFFLSSVLMYSQNSNPKISLAEKKRLENQFKALRTYYIDDSGLVVYQQSSDGDTSVDSVASPNTSKDDRHKDKSKSSVSLNNEENVPIIIKKQATEKTSVYVNAANTHVDIDLGDERKAIKPREQYAESSPKEITINKEHLMKAKESILNRKRTSRYKSMEEAALAVESLLEELKKEQAQTSSPNSMSSRLSRGVSHRLKKLPSTISNSSVNTSTSNSVIVQEELEGSEFGNEPSYFINGEQVEKWQIDKLSKNEIINKEIRIRNTVTGNPNGEVWYEVKK